MSEASIQVIVLPLSVLTIGFSTLWISSSSSAGSGSYFVLASWFANGLSDTGMSATPWLATATSISPVLWFRSSQSCEIGLGESTTTANSPSFGYLLHFFIHNLFVIRCVLLFVSDMTSSLRLKVFELTPSQLVSRVRVLKIPSFRGVFAGCLPDTGRDTTLSSLTAHSAVDSVQPWCNVFAARNGREGRARRALG